MNVTREIPNVTAEAARSPMRDGILDARVVFLTHYIPLYQVRVLQSIARRVRDFHVLVSTPIEPNRDFAPDWSGLNVTVQDTWTMRRQWKHRGDSEFSDSLYIHVPYDTSKRLKSLKPDVVMSLELGARSIGAARFCRRNPESKLVLCTYMSEHTEKCRGWFRHQVRKRLVRRADAITYNGPSCLRYLKQFPIPDEKLFSLPYAADDRTAYNGSIERDDSTSRGRLLVVGQLTDRKGVMPLVNQVDNYCRENPQRSVELIFAGDGPLKKVLSERLVPDNLTLRLLGNVPAAKLSQLMGDCGVLMAPTLADEWMLVVNEALHAGMPVIGSIYSQAVTTLIHEGVNGWQYDPVQEHTLHSALDRYFGTSPDVLASARHECRRSVADRSPDWAADGAIDAIEYVTRKGSRIDDVSGRQADPDQP